MTPSYVGNAIYMPIVKISEYQKEQAARWLDGDRTARLLYPDGTSNTYAANGTSLYSTMVTNLGNLTNNLPAINNSMAIDAVRKYTLPGFFKGHSISQLALTRAVKTGLVETVGQMYHNWLLIDDTHIVCVYASSTSLRAAYLTQSGNNWVLTSDKQLVTTNNTQDSKNVRLISIDTNKYLVTYSNTSGGLDTARCVAFTLISGVITEGTALDLPSTQENIPSPQKLSTDVAIIAGWQGSTSKATCWIVTATGVSLAITTTNDRASGGGGSTHKYYCRLLSPTKALIMAFNAGTSNTSWIATITGSSVAHGTEAITLMSASASPVESSIFTKNASGVWVISANGTVYAVNTSGATPTLDATIVAGANYNNVAYDATNNFLYINGSKYNVSTFASWSLSDGNINVAGFGKAFSTGGIIVATAAGVAYTYEDAEVEVKVLSPDGNTDNDEDTIVVPFNGAYTKTIDVDSNFYRKSFFTVKNTSTEAVSFSFSSLLCETL